MNDKPRPRIILIIPRGEAVRNFVYSDTIPLLSREADIILLSVVTEEKFLFRVKPFVKQIIPLKQYQEHALVRYIRFVVHEAHFRWLWSEVAKNRWETLDAEAKGVIAGFRRLLIKGIARLLANPPTLKILTTLENYLSCLLRPDNYFVDLFNFIKPDLVFNCSHIHGPAADLPIKIAHSMDITTAGFIFSWDNLTSRSRIFAPYDYYLVWFEKMHRQLLGIYPEILSDHVIVTGTPQFDFHFRPEFQMSREELCRKTGIDPARHYVLYTTGVARHFPQEHRTVELIASLIKGLNIPSKPQLVIRTYIKDTSPQMLALAKQNLPDVIFPAVLWDKENFTPMHEDLAIYTNLLRHCCLGINAASTVSLELMMFDKPVINIGFDPPGSNLPYHLRWARHIAFDHYKPVAESGAVMVARSAEDMKGMLYKGLSNPQADSKRRGDFIKSMLDNSLDGNSSRRVAEALMNIVSKIGTEKEGRTKID